MTEAPSVYERDDRPREDHFVHLRGSWDDYERVLEMRGDRSAPRICFDGEVIEIMSPSKNHEGLKSRLGRLVEAYCLERDIDFETVGSWTLKDAQLERGAEPDECYLIQSVDPTWSPMTDEDDGTGRPDLAIEVIWTSGGLDKLEIYRLLRVREVWIWRKGIITTWWLDDDTLQYVGIDESRVLAGIDLKQLMRFLEAPTTAQAIRAYRAALGG